MIFQSPGGSVIGSMLLGIEIRKYKMSTAVGRPRILPNRTYEVEPGDCASACVYAFLGGVTRSLRPQDRMLIHRTWVKPGKSAIGPKEQFIRGEAVQDVTAQLLKYVREMGVSTQLVEAALRVTSLDTRALTSEELERWNVVGISEDAKTPNMPELTTFQSPSRSKPRTAQKTSPTRNQRRTYFIFGVSPNDVLNVRTGPSFEHPVSGRIPPSAKSIEIIDSCVGVWCLVRYGNVTGYANRMYIKPQLGRRPAGFRVVHVANHDNLNLRRSPSARSQILYRIPPKAAGIRVVGRCRLSWCPIKFEGINGSVDGRYIEPY